MLRVLLFHCWIAASFVALLLTSRTSGLCDDLDTNACHTLFAHNKGLCNDTTFSTTACPRFCGKCPLTCYHCDVASADPSTCHTTKTCQPGERCMWLVTTDSMDGHHRYQMDCATKSFCDGDVLVAVGKRGVQARNVNIQCCMNDQCNNPALTTTAATTPTTRPPPTTTVENTCHSNDDCLHVIQCPSIDKYHCDRHHNCKCE